MHNSLKYEIETIKRTYYWASISFVCGAALFLIAVMTDRFQLFMGNADPNSNPVARNMFTIMDVVPPAMFMGLALAFYGFAQLFFEVRGNSVFTRIATFVVDAYVLFFANFLGVCAAATLIDRTAYWPLMAALMFVAMASLYASAKIFLHLTATPSNWRARVGFAALCVSGGIATLFLLK